MAAIIINKDLTVDEVNEKRLRRDFNLSHKERIAKAFKLMRLAILFSKRGNAKFKKRIIIKSV
jgi:hypothetical protein